ncbi:MAG: hypothetical protein IJ157_05265 [Clostridia bacterium]|nr:hypothetical protein [Clostridia bacterium]
MSEGRGKYSSTPLNGLKRARDGGYRVPPERSGRGRQRSAFVFLQVCMSALLPVLFVVALILRYTELHWCFLALSAVALLVMWGARAFVPQARTTMTLIYTALMMVSLGAALWFTHPMISRNGDAVQTQGNDYSAIFGRDTTAKDVQDFTVQQNLAPTVTPSPTVSAASQAQRQLENFMNSWMSLDYNAMLSYCVPSWVNAQENPQNAIFKIRGTSIPVDYDIQGASGTEADDSRTLDMIALIDKGTGRDPQQYQYKVLMLRVNGVWYVDPASLSSATEIKTEVTPTVQITLMPTYTVDASTRLYYNPDGGSYYHKNENCSKVALKYLPLKGTFLYSEITKPEYANLVPCDKCNPPNRPN